MPVRRRRRSRTRSARIRRRRACGCSRSIPPGPRASITAVQSIRRQLRVVARQQGDRLRVGAGRRIPRAVSDEDLRGRRRRRRRAADHRSPRHERVAAVLAGRHARSPSSRPTSAPASSRRAVSRSPTRRARNANMRAYPMNGAWIAEILWAPDSQAVYVTMNEGHVRDRRAHVRDAGREGDARRRQGRAPRRTSAPRCSTRSASAATAGRSRIAKSARATWAISS